MVKHMIEKEKRMGLVLVITGLIISIPAITRIIEWYINLGLSTSSWGILLIPSGALGLLLIIVGIYSLLSNPRMKGLLLLIIGSFLTGVGLYFTRYLLLNPKIIKSKSSSIYWTNILTIIGILINAYGIIRIRKKLDLELV